MNRQSIPKALQLYIGDINKAVIAVQQHTGIAITPEWWKSHVGNHGTSEEILRRFDEAYDIEVQKQRSK